jgi:nucleoside 2-deoxyribosyltransferase
LTLHVYIAGPDVFRPDTHAWADSVRALCAAHGCAALLPVDGGHTTAQNIYAGNIALIRQADVVLANLNAFRGAEPDSGTCFEVGYAVALGKRVIGYLDSSECTAERVARIEGRSLTPSPRGPLDAAGRIVEDFGLPVNLMLAIPAEVIAGDLAAALRRALVLGAAPSSS